MFADVIAVRHLPCPVQEHLGPVGRLRDERRREDARVSGGVEQPGAAALEAVVHLPLLSGSTVAVTSMLRSSGRAPATSSATMPSSVRAR
ncbi:hypothetical protein [Dactylosporangium sp. NPDC049140]|uniref:hypothetical protein n=1 Tax=Dactylosporangium sp. NPDC049140 TaxID=3155647 RepID=UPI0033C6C449